MRWKTFSLWCKESSWCDLVLLSLCWCLPVSLSADSGDTLTKEQWAVLCSCDWSFGSVWICGLSLLYGSPGSSLEFIFCLNSFGTVNKSLNRLSKSCLTCYTSACIFEHSSWQNCSVLLPILLCSWTLLCYVASSQSKQQMVYYSNSVLQ